MTKKSRGNTNINSTFSPYLLNLGVNCAYCDTSKRIQRLNVKLTVKSADEDRGAETILQLRRNIDFIKA